AAERRAKRRRPTISACTGRFHRPAGLARAVTFTPSGRAHDSAVPASARPLRHDVERQRRGVRDVEALDAARKIEPRPLVAGRARQLPRSLALRAEHQRERRAQRGVAEVGVPGAVEADQQKSSARARFCTVTIGTYSSAPEADFASTPVASGLWRAVVTTALTANP